MLPFPNDLKHFEICPTFDLAEIGQQCGLQLNDPIDCFKLRLNQPKRVSLLHCRKYVKHGNNMDIVSQHPHTVTKMCTDHQGVQHLDWYKNWTVRKFSQKIEI